MIFTPIIIGSFSLRGGPKLSAALIRQFTSRTNRGARRQHEGDNTNNNGRARAS